MRIAQISPGLIEIPPKGWGAIEVIIWNYKIELEKLGHSVDIKNHMDDLSNYDIVHVHVHNQASYLADRRIPYIFTLHDSHIHAENVFFNEHNYVIEKSMITIFPSKYHLDYFNVPKQKMVYLSHGVDTQLHQRTKYDLNKNPKLLILAKNYPMADIYDNKGFELSVNIAKELDLPITIAGPNAHWFKDKPDDIKLEYDKLTIVDENFNKEELNTIFSDHDIFLHPSVHEAGQPCLLVLEALANGLPVISHKTDKDLILSGIEFIDRDVQQGVKAVNTILKEHRLYSDVARQTAIEHDWKIITNRLELIYKKFVRENSMKDELMNAYKSTIKQPNNMIDKEYTVDVDVNFIEGAYCEIRGNDENTYKIIFTDLDNNFVLYQQDMKCNTWCKTNREWFTNYNISVLFNDNILFSHNYTPTGKRVYIAFDSKALGDTIAWFPYAEEFRKKYDCEVIVSTFWNNLFKNKYPMLQFVEPGDEVENLYAMYEVGIKGDGHTDLAKNKSDTRKEPLQKIACDYLGLEYTEIIPDLSENKKETNKNIKQVYVRFDSSSLGDSIAWIPQVLKYKKLNNVDVIVSTSWNDIFKKVYPELEFTNPDSDSIRYDKIYTIGAFIKGEKGNIFDYRSTSLQKIASNTLEMDFEELKPLITKTKNFKKNKKKYVTIGIQSTTQAKYWNVEKGWLKIVDYLKTKGYDVISVDRHERYGTEGHWNDVPKNVTKNENEKPLQRIIDVINNAEFHIGTSSGLSWVAYATNTPVIMISGLTKPWNEFTTGIIRLHNNDVCNGCMNDTNHIFDKGNWLWCPAGNDFICSKEISIEDVKNAIDKMEDGDYAK